jgi:hypothetical protein
MLLDPLAGDVMGFSQGAHGDLWLNRPLILVKLYFSYGLLMRIYTPFQLTG